MERQPRVGEPVLYYPAKAVVSIPDASQPFQKKVDDPDQEVKANNNEDGPVAAVITRHFGNGGPELPVVNLTIFPDGTQPVFRSFVAHQSTKLEGQGHWTYLDE